MVAQVKFNLGCFFVLMITNNGQAKPKDIHIHLEGIREHNGRRIDYTIPPPDGLNKVVYKNLRQYKASFHKRDDKIEKVA